MAYDEKSKERTMRYLEKLKEIRFRVNNEKSLGSGQKSWHIFCNSIEV